MSTTLVGNVVANPEMKFVGDSSVTTFSIAVNKKRGEETYTSYFDCAVWGPFGENVANTLSKGDRVLVFGEMKQRSYEDKNGNKRSAVELQVEAVGPELRFATATVQKL
jgi:single-strand DNA-binding protein